MGAPAGQAAAAGRVAWQGGLEADWRRLGTRRRRSPRDATLLPHGHRRPHLPGGHRRRSVRLPPLVRRFHRDAPLRLLLPLLSLHISWRCLLDSKRPMPHRYKLLEFTYLRKGGPDVAEHLEKSVVFLVDPEGATVHDAQAAKTIDDAVNAEENVKAAECELEAAEQAAKEAEEVPLLDVYLVHVCSLFMQSY